MLSPLKRKNAFQKSNPDLPTDNIIHMVGTDEAEIQGLGLSMSYGEKLCAPAKIFFFVKQKNRIMGLSKRIG